MTKMQLEAGNVLGIFHNKCMIDVALIHERDHNMCTLYFSKTNDTELYSCDIIERFIGFRWWAKL